MRTDDQPSWDDDRGAALVGRTVLLGLTFTTADGEASNSCNATE